MNDQCAVAPGYYTRNLVKIINSIKLIIESKVNSNTTVHLLLYSRY